MENRETEEVPLSFEAALQRWEEVVGLLERGSLTLEESLQLYEDAFAGPLLRAVERGGGEDEDLAPGRERHGG
jgi:hypothetical protein